MKDCVQMSSVGIRDFLMCTLHLYAIQCFGYLNDMVYQNVYVFSPMLYIYLKEKIKKIFDFLFFCFSFINFMGTPSANLHETFLVYQGQSNDLKGLLHMLSTTAIPMKVSQDFILFSRIFIFILLKDERSLGVRVFVEPKIHNFVPFHCLIIS